MQYLNILFKKVFLVDNPGAKLIADGVTRPNSVGHTPNKSPEALTIINNR